MKHLVAVLLTAPALALAVMSGPAYADPTPPTVPEVATEGPGQTPTPSVTVVTVVDPAPESGVTAKPSSYTCAQP